MKQQRNKKGVTPIIAVILLMMMTVAAAGAAFFWIVRVQATLSGGTEQHIDSVVSNIGSMAEMVNVQYTNVNETTGNMTFIVRNRGTIPFTLTNVSTIMTLSEGDGTIICNNNWGDATMFCLSGCGGEVDVSSSQLVTLNLTGDCDLEASYTDGETIQYSVDFPGDATAGGSFRK